MSLPEPENNGDLVQRLIISNTFVSDINQLFACYNKEIQLREAHWKQASVGRKAHLHFNALHKHTHIHTNPGC